MNVGVTRLDHSWGRDLRDEENFRQTRPWLSEFGGSARKSNNCVGRKAYKKGKSFSGCEEDGSTTSRKRNSGKEIL